MSRWRVPACGLLLLVGLELPAAAQTDPLRPESLLDRLQATWETQDALGYASLWAPGKRSDERAFATHQFAADETRLTLRRPRSVAEAAKRFEFRADVFTVREPRGRVEQWLLTAERGESGWRLVARESVGLMDGLVHLSLDPAGFQAAGLRFELEDFVLEMRQGTLFTSPQELGPTALVFVGKGTMRFRPRPETEQDQLVQLSGRPELVEDVQRAFVRIHPADLTRVLSPLPLRPDPAARARLKDALEFYEAHTYSTFVLDARSPRSPWWLVPSPGEAVVTFDAGRRGVLTFSVSGEPEGISLLDRKNRRQICLYPRAGHVTDYSEDDNREADLIHRDVRLRVDPDQRRLTGTATLRLRLLSSRQTLQLRLDRSLAVQSVTSTLGAHLFFRVRDRDTLMVMLGRLASSSGEISLTVRYAGVLSPGPIENEVLQLSDQPRTTAQFPIEPVLVYTNRRAWHPRLGRDDYATAGLRFDVPADHLAVSGGLLVSSQLEGERRIMQFEQEQPVRYHTVVIGRLERIGERRAGSTNLLAYASQRASRATRSDFDVAQEILDFYSHEFGPCPAPHLSIVGIEGETPGGHSPPGMIVLSYRPRHMGRRLRDDPAQVSGAPHFFLAHELAHQWWGHGVAPQNYRERWISESFAHYAAALWLRHSQGEDAFQRALKQFDRWARRMADQGPIHLGYRLGHIRGSAQVFRAVVYAKGAYVLHMLRGVVGEELFREALARLQQQYRFQKIGTRHVREALEEVSGRELGAYFDAWVFGTRVPRLRVAHRTGKTGSGREVEVEVEVRPMHLPGAVPLEILIGLSGGDQRRKVTLLPEGGAWTFVVPTKPRKIEVNSDLGLLAELKKL